METFSSIKVWKNFRASLNIQSTIGLIPTMGAIHKGHLSLIKRSIAENDYTVVSIFVNPTQFNDSNDFENYPKDIDKDKNLLFSTGIDALLIPDKKDVYSEDYRFKVAENKYSKLMEGSSRPGHFDGVLTIIMKLLHIVSPSRTYFGKKDYQQLKLIKDMVSSFFIDTKIIACKTIRDSDGLALSSRNQLISSEKRKVASKFYHSLRSSKSSEEIKIELNNIGFDVDYIEEHDGRRFGAIKLGRVRLIDNVKI
tara:strand:- start:51669 stop:52427 length:759 start_codon:yes stop_codon:yes gene_type:complete